MALNPVFIERGFAEDRRSSSKAFRENSMDLLFGDTDLAKRLEISGVRVTTDLTLTSSNTKTLLIKTKSWTPDDNKVDMFEELLKLQEILPPNSIEFNLSFHGFLNDNTRRIDKKLDFDGKGLKLGRDDDNLASLQLTDTLLAKEIGWKDWSSRRHKFTGWISLNVRLNIAAVTELYKKHFGRDPLTAELGTATDLVILVDGNKDREKAIKCHKSILSEMSPVFAAMFQTDMVEAKEGTLEIVDFSDTVIRALVEFAYRRNLEEAWENSEMTVELLEVANKYQMKDLMDMLLYIIWCTPFSWFSADVALKLFFFAKNEGEDLAQAGDKAWKALKWYAEEYPEKLLESQEGASLCESPRAVMALVVLLLKCK